MKNIFAILLFALSIPALAQYQVKGILIDNDNSEAIIAATVQLNKDSEVVQNTFSDIDGKFSFNSLAPGKYQLGITYIGYDKITREIEIKNSNIDLGSLKMGSSAITTEEIQVKARQVRVEMKGDTTAFNADAYKVNPDASAEDLIRKMPGIEIENGQLKAQGEAVKKILIDGQEFFGDDVSTAIKNLPAEVISQIEVFDRLSDQAQFSGFNDGQTDKTINIITRSGKSSGQFGRFAAGLGTDNRYNAGLNFNHFEGNQRISILGLSNNINMRNFSSDDMGGGAMMGGMGGGGMGGMGGGGMGGGMGGATSGITKTNSFGLNYIDKWGSKINVSASYFFTNLNNTVLDSLKRTTFISDGLNQYYSEERTQKSGNGSHRINARITYDINSKNSIIFTPNISFNSSNSSNVFDGVTLNETGGFVNTIGSDQNSNRDGFSLRGNVLFRHRFEKRGRTFSIGVGTNNNNNNSRGNLYSMNTIFRPDPTATILDQISSDTTRANGYNVRADYTEPLSENSQLQFSYNGNYNQNTSDKRTFDFNEEIGSHDNLNPVLSNSFSNAYNTHSETVSYRYAKRGGLQLNAGLSFQQALLRSDQLFPIQDNISRNFYNVLPSAMLTYNFSQTSNLRLQYRSNTNAPSVNQLQNVVDNSNPLQLRAGSPDLKQEVSHNITLRYNNTNIEKASNFFAFINGGITDNNISNSIFTATKDTVFRGVPLAKGSQLTLPINYGQAWRTNAFITYGFPVKWLRSNLNLNAGTSYSKSPSLSNGLENVSSNLRVSSGVVIGSNISQWVDFTLSYNGAYNWINYSLNPNMNSNYYSQTMNAKINLLSKKGLLFTTEGVNMLYSGLGEGFDQNYTLLNMSIGHKFFKNRSGELKLSVFDLLNQNTSLSRNATNAYIEDKRSLVLNRYYMLTFTFNLRNFKSGGMPTGRPGGPEGFRQGGGGFGPGGGGGFGPGGGGGGWSGGGGGRGF
jgi:hypothetical protein